MIDGTLSDDFTLERYGTRNRRIHLSSARRSARLWCCNSDARHWPSGGDGRLSDCLVIRPAFILPLQAAQLVPVVAGNPWRRRVRRTFHCLLSFDFATIACG